LAPLSVSPLAPLAQPLELKSVHSLELLMAPPSVRLLVPRSSVLPSALLWVPSVQP